MEIFLILLGLVWLLVASIQDIKKREVANWLSFSLIIFTLAYKALYSAIYSNFWFFLHGLIGFFLFVCLAYIFYYARIFAGGDAKLLMSLGAILSFSNMFYENLVIYASFVLLFLFSGGVYSLVYSGILAFKDREKFSKEFKKQIKLNKKLFYISFIFAVTSMIFVFYSKDLIFLAFPFLFLLFPVMLIYGKTVEENFMIVSVDSREVTIGDWLYEEVSVGRKKIKPYWEGLSEEEVKLLRKSRRKVKIKKGIPFVPAFLIAFLLLIIFKDYFSGLFSLI